MDKENRQLAPKKKDAKTSVDYADLADSCSSNVVSGTECTGLIPTPPESEQESEAYSDLGTIPMPAADGKNIGQKKGGKG